MGIADGMKRITEDIISSYDLRVKSLGQLVGDVHEPLDKQKTIHLKSVHLDH